MREEMSRVNRQSENTYVRARAHESRIPLICISRMDHGGLRNVSDVIYFLLPFSTEERSDLYAREISVQAYTRDQYRHGRYRR